MERHSLQSIEALWRMLAILTPIALRLLLILQAAQQATEIPATEVVSPSCAVYCNRGIERV
jgi:hypothetical protein